MRLSGLCLVAVAMAANSTATSVAAEETAPPGVIRAIATLLPGVEPESIEPAPLAGLYEVVLGPHIVYVSADGRYLVRGDVLDLEARANLTEAKRRQARLAAVETLGESSMIVYAPEGGKAEHTVTVFTDVDCPYCQRLHREVPELVEQGVAVRYLAFPRAGIPSGSYDKMMSVWCADDRQRAMTDAKSGGSVTGKRCDNPIEQHYAMGQRVGITGTPTILLEDGEMIPGYVPAQRLINMLREGGSN